MPPSFEARIAWDTLRIESGIAVSDQDLDEQRMDILYSVRAAGKRVLIYVLAEHQSTVDAWMVFRMLCYLVAIWKIYRARYPRAKKLPLILPLVVHHSPTGWTAPGGVRGHAGATWTRRCSPRSGRTCHASSCCSNDLAVQGDEALRSRRKMTAGGRLVILSLKHGRDPVAVRVQALWPDREGGGGEGCVPGASCEAYILETRAGRRRPGCAGCSSSSWAASRRRRS